MVSGGQWEDVKDETSLLGGEEREERKGRRGGGGLQAVRAPGSPAG